MRSTVLAVLSTHLKGVSLVASAASCPTRHLKREVLQLRSFQGAQIADGHLLQLHLLVLLAELLHGLMPTTLL